MQNKKLQTLVGQLPDFCQDFFIYMEIRKSINTRIAYAYDYCRFFKYLYASGIDSITLQAFGNLSFQFLNSYFSFLNQTSSAATVGRNIASLKSLYNYFYLTRQIEKNPMTYILAPKVPEHPIIHLNSYEKIDLLENVVTGKYLTSTQKRYNQITSLRDYTIITLILTTGIRVSECHRLNISHINLQECYFTIQKKGGDYIDLFLSDQMIDILKGYMIFRASQLPNSGHEDALFLSLKKNRLSVRSIETMIKKYTQTITQKPISPHKLRSTFGSDLYNTTGDIFLVSNVLGHKNVETTKKYYAAVDVKTRYLARNKVQLIFEK